MIQMILERKGEPKDSAAWIDFKDVEVGFEKTLQSECLHCRAKFKKIKTGTTSSLLRHLKNCAERLKKVKKAEAIQQKINFSATDSSSVAHSYLYTGKFDMAAMRESAAEWVLMHEHLFTIVEEDGFNI